MWKRPTETWSWRKWDSRVFGDCTKRADVLSRIQTSCPTSLMFQRWTWPFPRRILTRTGSGCVPHMLKPKSWTQYSARPSGIDVCPWKEIRMEGGYRPGALISWPEIVIFDFDFKKKVYWQARLWAKTNLFIYFLNPGKGHLLSRRPTGGCSSLRPIYPGASRSINTIQRLSGSTPRWVLIVTPLCFQSLTFMLNIGLFIPTGVRSSQGAGGNICISLSSQGEPSPFRDTQGFHGNLLSQLHKRVLGVRRDLGRETTNTLHYYQMLCCEEAGHRQSDTPTASSLINTGLSDAMWEIVRNEFYKHWLSWTFQNCLRGFAAHLSVYLRYVCNYCIC